MSKMGQHVYDQQNGYAPQPPVDVQASTIVRIPESEPPYGTSLQGYVFCKYSELVEIFGEENYNSTSIDDKVTHEWYLTFSLLDCVTQEPVETVRASIYDWKNYDGGELVRSNGVVEFHIGGLDSKAVECVKRVMKSNENKIQSGWFNEASWKLEGIDEAVQGADSYTLRKCVDEE